MLATVSDVETLFQTTFAAGAELDAITLALQAADAAVKGHVGTDLEETARTAEKHDVLRPLVHWLWTDHWPISSVTVTEWDGSAQTALTIEEDFEIGDAAFGRLDRTYDRTRARSWRQGYRTVEVTYTSGYSTVPKDLVDLTASIANRIYEEAKAGVSTSGSGVVDSEKIGDYSVGYDTSGEAVLAGRAGRVGSITTAEQAILGRYARPVLL